MVVDARERFAERTAKMLADLSLSLQEQGIEPFEQLAERTANFSDEYDSMVHAKLSEMSELSLQSFR